jgi:hypothetical protein
MMVVAVVLVLLFAFGWSMWLDHGLSHAELLRRSSRGWLTIELRRRAAVMRMKGDLQDYPCPREVRIRTLRCSGIPIWQDVCSIGLPPQCDACIDQLRAEQFDHMFNRDFQLH